MNFDGFGVYMAMQKHIEELQAAADKTLCDMLAAAAAENSDSILINKCSAYLFIRLSALEDKQRRELRAYAAARLPECGYGEVLRVFDVDDVKDAITR